MTFLPLRSFGDKLDGRWLALAMIAFYSLSVVAIHDFFGKPYYKVLRPLGVPAYESPFLDLRNLPAAIEILHAGGDPRVSNPADPLQRRYNYPRLWLDCGYLGLNQHTVEIFGVGMGLLTLGCILLTLGRIDCVDGLMAGCFVISPAVVLGFERGNIDLSIFCLLTLALTLRRMVPVTTMVIVLATILKIFPAFSLLALVTPPWRKMFSWLIGAVALLFFYFITDLKELRFISQNTPLLSGISYGSITFLIWLFNLPPYFDAHLRFKLLLVGAMAMLALAIVAVRKGPRVATSLVFAERELFAFRMGAGIYLGTFALGSNVDYRTLFLIFCLPLLFRLRREADPIKTWAKAALFFILGYVNWNFFSDESTDPHVALKQALAWGLVYSLISVLAVTFFRRYPQSASGADELAPLGTSSAKP